MLGYGRSGCTMWAQLCSLLTLSPRTAASLDPLRTIHSHGAITETLANIYIKVDSIPRRNLPNFRLLGYCSYSPPLVRGGDRVYVIRDIVFSHLPSNCELAPALEPEFSYPAMEQACHICGSNALPRALPRSCLWL